MKQDLVQLHLFQLSGKQYNACLYGVFRSWLPWYDIYLSYQATQSLPGAAAAY